MPKDLIGRASPSDDCAYDIHRISVRQISGLSKRVDVATKTGEITAWTTIPDRRLLPDMIDLMIDVACTASLTAYLRPGERWNLDFAKENSARGLVIVAALHELRCKLVEKASILTPARVKSMRGGLSEAMAIVILALDAAPAGQADRLAMLAGLGRTNDPQGDAQLRAEEISSDDALYAIFDAMSGKEAREAQKQARTDDLFN